MSVDHTDSEKTALQRQIDATDRQIDGLVYELKMIQTKIAAELDALLPSVLDRAFKGGAH